jgi:hypothetical protein
MVKYTRKFRPKKYFSGLSQTKRFKRAKEIQKFSSLNFKNPKAYKGFQTDKGIKTRSSQYTLRWNRLYPDAKSLSERSKATGVPEQLLRESYNRGLAAWRTGHRPGATQQQWGYARVSSFLLCGKTHYTTDADLVRQAKTTSISARRWFKRCV